MKHLEFLDLPLTTNFSLIYELQNEPNVLKYVLHLDGSSLRMGVSSNWLKYNAVVDMQLMFISHGYMGVTYWLKESGVVDELVKKLLSKQEHVFRLLWLGTSKQVDVERPAHKASASRSVALAVGRRYVWNVDPQKSESLCLMVDRHSL